jgi:hypothetical protein
LSLYLYNIRAWGWREGGVCARLGRGRAALLARWAMCWRGCCLLYAEWWQRRRHPVGVSAEEVLTCY